MDTLLQDVRYALRTLARSPGFTAAAVVALALGVGGSSAIFSVLEGVVLRPLAAPHPGQLVRLYETVPGDAPGHERNPALGRGFSSETDCQAARVDPMLSLRAE